jgi:basic amino acid/polyamine antiporter, APA family
MSSAAAFKRTIGFKSATAIVIGSVIGSGVYVRPADMAAVLGSPLLVFAAWIAVGIFSFFNAMIQAEVASMFPETGGQYVFLRKMYSDFWGYLYGWANFAVINTAGVVAICFIGAEYSNYFFHFPQPSQETVNLVRLHLPGLGNIYPLHNLPVKLLTICYLIILTSINYRSTLFGTRFQGWVTAIKLASIATIVLGAFFSSQGSFSNLTAHSVTINPTGLPLMLAFSAACTGALYAFDGWGNIMFVSGEIKNPQKTLPVALLSGILVTIFCYVGVTAAYLLMLPVDTLAHSKLAASDAATIAFGKGGAAIIAAFIIISTLGCVNGNILTPPRLTFAMARHKEFFSFAGKVHSKNQTPGNAILAHLGWMIFIVVIGNFYLLADMFIFVTWCFNLMMIAGLFVLRRKMPNADRPFKVWMYPVLPAVIFVFTLGYLIMSLYTDIDNYLSGKTELIYSLFGVLLTLLGVPLFWYFRKKYGKYKPEIPGDGDSVSELSIEPSSLKEEEALK